MVPTTGPGGDHPAFHLPDIAYIVSGTRRTSSFGGRPRRARTFRTGSAQTVLLHPGQMIPASDPGFANTHSGIPEGGKQHMVR